MIVILFYSVFRKDFGAYRDQLSRTIVPYVNSCRQVVMDTCHLTMIFVTILVLVDSLGAVTWIYLKRSVLGGAQCGGGGGI